MRNRFAELLYKAAVTDDRIHVVVADISPAGSMAKFREEFPERFINVGVAEQAMIGICAGLAREGAIPFAYTIAAFSVVRPYEFIRDDIALNGLGVNIVGIGGGLIYSTLGPTHHTTDDIGLMSLLPSMRIFSPADGNEVEYVMKNILGDNASQGPSYLRLGKAGEPNLIEDVIKPGDLVGNFRRIISNIDSKTLIICYGMISHRLLILNKLLLTNYNLPSDLVTMPSVNPIEWNIILPFISRYRNIIIVEEHLDIGSIGLRISTRVHESFSDKIVIRINLENSFVKKYGSYDEILDDSGFSVDFMAKKIINKILQPSKYFEYE
jgi:transketolase